MIKKVITYTRERKDTNCGIKLVIPEKCHIADSANVEMALEDLDEHNITFYKTVLTLLVGNDLKNIWWDNGEVNVTTDCETLLKAYKNCGDYFYNENITLTTFVTQALQKFGIDWDKDNSDETVADRNLEVFEDYKTLFKKLGVVESPFGLVVPKSLGIEI